MLYKTKYQGYYVDENGDVFSFRKPAPKSKVRFDLTRKPKKLSYKIDKDGYFEVVLSVNCKRYYKKVHQIVAETFLGDKPSANHCVDHINRNRQDNRPSNLRWLEISQNSDGHKGKKTKACKRCIYDGVLYYSILDALKVIGMDYKYLWRHPELYTVSTIEGVETIEIRKVSRVGRKWLPLEAHTDS